MKKALLAIGLTFMMSATTLAADDEPTRKNEFLGGYMRIDVTDGEKFNGFNLEYRQHKNDYFGYGGSLNYGYTKVNGPASSADVSLSALDAYVMLKMPIKQAYVYGKAGLALTAADATGTICNEFSCYDASMRDNDFGMVYGFGLNVPIRNNWALDVSYTKKEPEFDFGHGMKGKSKQGSLFIQAGYRF